MYLNYSVLGVKKKVFFFFMEIIIVFYNIQIFEDIK